MDNILPLIGRSNMLFSEDIKEDDAELSQAVSTANMSFHY